MSQSSHGTDNCRANCAINCKTRRQRNKQREKEERASKRVNERERSDPQNATCCMRWGTGHTVNLFVLSVAKSRALNSRFVEGVEKGVCPANERGRVRGRRTPKALQPVKLNQMRKPQKKASIADRKLDPTRNVWSLFF